MSDTLTLTLTLTVPACVQLHQEVVTYASPVEAYATGIKNESWSVKIVLDRSVRGSWLFDFTGVQRTKRSHASKNVRDYLSLCMLGHHM